MFADYTTEAISFVNTPSLIRARRRAPSTLFVLVVVFVFGLFVLGRRLGRAKEEEYKDQNQKRECGRQALGLPAAYGGQVAWLGEAAMPRHAQGKKCALKADFE